MSVRSRPSVSCILVRGFEGPGLEIHPLPNSVSEPVRHGVPPSRSSLVHTRPPGLSRASMTTTSSAGVRAPPASTSGQLSTRVRAAERPWWMSECQADARVRIRVFPRAPCAVPEQIHSHLVCRDGRYTVAPAPMTATRVMLALLCAHAPEGIAHRASAAAARLAKRRRFRSAMEHGVRVI